MDAMTLPEIGTSEHTALIAKQNDQFRRWHTVGERKPGIFVPGKSVWTASFEAEDADFKGAVLKAIGEIEDFPSSNDPDGFHDFGSVKVSERDVWFKIDTYDQNYQYGSEDPANLKINCRVMTILFPSDW